MLPRISHYFANLTDKYTQLGFNAISHVTGELLRYAIASYYRYYRSILSEKMNEKQEFWFV